MSQAMDVLGEDLLLLSIDPRSGRIINSSGGDPMARFVFVSGGGAIIAALSAALGIAAGG